MIESRLAKIILLDGSQLDFHITPEILTSNLLDMVASYLTLKDKEYFGISYMDSTCHRNWLQLDKKVLDHDLPKKSNILIFFFRVKFYIESIAFTKDKMAVELFYLQAKFSIVQNEIEISQEILYELTALVLQSIYGDFKSESETVNNLKGQSILPKSFLVSTINSAQKVISYYRKCVSMNRGQCIVNYLSIIEKLCNYGVHYYEVKDKSNIKWYLGISFRGIGLYEYTNKVTPKKIFLWSKLENLYYRDRKFSIEVHESLSQQKEISPLSQDLEIIDGSFNPVKVYAWFASIPSLCKSIWLMAVSQHQFYLDKKQSKDVLLQYKSLNDLAAELTNENISTGNQQQEIDEIMVLNDEGYNEKSHMLLLLKKKQELLTNKLNLKKTFFNKINKKQQEIIEFSKIIPDDKACIYNVMSLIKDLKYTASESQQNQYNFQIATEEEMEVQKKIMLMALNLASNPSANQLKARRDFYERAKKKFTKLENFKENKEYYESYPNELNQIMNTSTESMGKNSENSGSKIQSKLSNYFNEDVVVDLIDSVSPASIHRKDSYRRAQEHKLFLENNKVNKVGRTTNSKRVKNILNESKSQYNNNVRPEINFIENSYGKFNNNSQSNNNFQKIFVNNLYDVKNFKDEMLELKAKSVSPKELIGFDLNHIEDKMNSATDTNSNNSSRFEQNDIENLNRQIKNTEISIKVDQIRNISQRKNTSDSNVKLLADHNFYHISNKQHQQHSNGYNQTYRESIPTPSLSENNHSSSSSRIAFKVNPRPYEPTEVFKYNNKYRRGLNSSSNSLMSLNESSASPNEDLNHTNSETNLMRSNPDLNIEFINQKKNVNNYNNQSPKLHSPNTCHVSVNNGSFTSRTKNNLDHHITTEPSYNLKNDIQTSYSNNASLNLSIHTAEEFSIEMLSWLKNETNGMKISADDSIDKIDNATLV